MHLYTSPLAGDASVHACLGIQVLCVYVCMYAYARVFWTHKSDQVVQRGQLSMLACAFKYYVFMCVCMHIRIPACRHVILYVCMHACMHQWMTERIKHKYSDTGYRCLYASLYVLSPSPPLSPPRSVSLLPSLSPALFFSHSLSNLDFQTGSWSTNTPSDSGVQTFIDACMHAYIHTYIHTGSWSTNTPSGLRRGPGWISTTSKNGRDTRGTVASKSAEGAIWYVHICMTLAYLYGTCIFILYLHICTVFAYGTYGCHTLANAFARVWHPYVPTVPVCIRLNRAGARRVSTAPLYRKCSTVDAVD